MRVLIRTPNWLGDIVMALPATAAVRRHFSSATLCVAAPVALAPLFKAVEGIDEIIGLSGHGLVETKQEITTIAKENFDTAILFPNSFRSAWVLYRAGVPERWGYKSDFRGWLLSRAIRKLKHEGRHQRHQVNYYGDLVRGLGINSNKTNPRLIPSRDMKVLGADLLDRRNVARDSGPFIGIAPGAAYGHAKRWSPLRFAEVILRLYRSIDATCVLVGSNADRDAGSAIESALLTLDHEGQKTLMGSQKFVNLIGMTDISTLIGIVSQCQAFLSNDSGAMHLASALDIPVTAVFGPSDEFQTSPLGRHTILVNPVRCRPCLLRECPIDHRCMSGISSDQVLEALKQQLVEATS